MHEQLREHAPRRVSISKSGSDLLPIGSFADRVLGHMVVMAPLGWLACTGAATLGDIVPSMAARKAMGYPPAPYNFGDEFVRYARSLGPPLNFAIVALGLAVIWALHENGMTALAAPNHWVVLGAWCLVSLYFMQETYWFRLTIASFAEWASALAVTVVFALIYLAISVLTRPVRTRLCGMFTSR